MRPCNRPGWAILLLDPLRDFVVVLSSVDGKYSSLQVFQGVDERVTMDRYNHFHGLSGLSAWLGFTQYKSLWILYLPAPPGQCQKCWQLWKTRTLQ